MSRTPSSEEELFARALLQPAGRCRAFIEEACGTDSGLRDRLLALVAAHAGSESLLASAPPVRPGLNEERTGDTIDRYKLLQRIGEGGCGVVWMAEQEEPVRRRVALKVIKLGMDTKAVVARFEAERQALAMMDHPHIAKVLDGGATHTGRPYFVMELVRGIPITRFCDDHRLTPKGRLELFVQVCQAIQHAHQKGIIHRDIKPSNVLVTLHEKTPVPAVIDFGIAKATQGRLTDATLFTAFDQFLGTPVYTSPEQAEYNALDIDTRSDIYSLGVLLYELLTGRPPFDAKAIQQTGLDEFRRMIREVEPPRPSTCVQTLGHDEQKTVSSRRGIPAGQLPAILRGDLDWIVMKALEKNRVRRYQTANAFAMDVQRYLADEPIVARPPGAVYRSVKFIRRHRVAVAAAAAVVLALVAGIIASTWQALRATRAEQAAITERKGAVEARQRAENLLDFMIGELRDEVQKLGKLDLLDRVGAQATAYFTSLDPRELSDEALVRQVKTLRQIGEVQIEKARWDDASKALHAAYSRARALTTRQPGNGEAIFERAQTEFYIGVVHRQRADLSAAVQWLTRYRDSGEELVRLDAGKLRWQREYVSGHHNLAVLDLDRGDIDKARAGFLAELAKVQEMSEANPDDLTLLFRVGDVHSWLGSVAERSGNLPHAAERFRLQVGVLESLVRKDPLNARWRMKLADSLALYAGILAITGARGASLEHRARARALLDAAVAADPENQTRLRDALYARLREAGLIRAEGATRRAAALVTDALSQLRRFQSEDPANRALVEHTAVAWRMHAELSLEQGENSTAAHAIQRALELLEGQIGAGRRTRTLVAEVAHAHLTAGLLSRAQSQEEAARRHWEKGWEAIASHLPHSRDWLVLDPAARILALLGRVDDGRAIRRRLDGFGYRPLQPWPAETDEISSSNRNPQPP